MLQQAEALVVAHSVIAACLACHASVHRATQVQPAVEPTGMDDAGPDSVRLLDDQTFETVDRYGLEPTEVCCSIASMSFAEDPASYYVIGTALTVAEEPEPTKVRLLLLDFP